MKNLVKYLVGCVGLFALISNVFAIEAPTNVEANTSTQSIELTWDAVEGAMFYNIYYSDVPGVDILTAENSQYESSNTLEVTDLKPNTQYYFILSSIDEQGQESVYTPELTFTTQSAEKTTEASTVNDTEIVETQSSESQDEMTNDELTSADEFQLEKISVKYQNEVLVTFNSHLDKQQQDDMLFQVTKLDDESQQYFLSGSVVDENDPFTAILTFEENLPLETDYKLVAISVFDVKGRNIESGIESYDNFYVEADTPVKPLESQEEPEVVDEVIPEEPKKEDTTPEAGALNSADDKDVIIENDVHSAAKDQDVLPQTGPTHILMLLVALVFGAMAFVFRYQK